MTKTNRQQLLQTHITRLEHRLAIHQQTSERFTWLRLALVAIGLTLTGATSYWINLTASGVILFIALLAFSSAVYFHSRIKHLVKQLQANLTLKSTQLARLQLDWENIPNLTRHHPNYDHPFAADLDILGDKSLFHLLDTTVSHESSERLINWLTTMIPDKIAIEQRQALVKELAPMFIFRDRLIINAVVATNSRKMWGATGVQQWLSAVVNNNSLRPWLAIAWVLIGLNGLLLGLSVVGFIPAMAWQLSYIFYLILMMSRVRSVDTIFSEAVRLHETFKQMGAVFEQLERFSYHHTPHLHKLCQPFQQAEHAPSTYLRRLTRWVLAASLRNNPLMWLLLNSFVPWDLVVAYQLGRQQRAMAHDAPAWFEAWFELEAICALANFSYLHPTYTLPTIETFEVLKPANSLSKNSNIAILQTSQLGHPLIPETQKICNDFQVNNLGEITMITGSNMAGKSTFMRTIGINLVLAYAGGPVNADYLKTGLFRLFTCIKVSDSVTSGFSYFYAEVRRLKQLLTELETEHELPLLYFIDEIFRGTNNRERLIGSQAYVTSLIGQAGLGFISTHDLELAKLAEHDDRITNYHFRDSVVNNRMHFDYILHSGPCPTTNALKLMALEGLPIKE